MRRYAALTLLFLTVFVLVTNGVQYQGGSDWRQWSLRQCKTMLDQSPWGKTIILDDPHAGDGAFQMGSVFEVRLSSALPIREASVRLQQINRGYEQMTDIQKKVFDESAERFLTRSFEDIIVFQVDYTQSRHISKAKIEAIREDASDYGDCFLVIDHKEKVRPIRFQIVKGLDMYELTFPRAINGRPTVAEKAQVITLQFPQLTQDNPSGTVSVSFVLERMKVNGGTTF